MSIKKDYDAVVVGSGPNGLAAAITLQQTGLSVLLLEGKKEIGGGLSTEQLTLPGFLHDTCSAIHPMAAGSPLFKTLPLSDHGLQFVQPAIAAAHPFDDATSAVLTRSLSETAFLLGKDERAYIHLMQGIVTDWPRLYKDILGPLQVPKEPLAMARFGIKAITSALRLSRTFSTKQGKGLWAGMAAHSIQPLSNYATSAIGLVLMAAGHLEGWPIPLGGSQSIARALASYFVSIGGKIETNIYVKSIKQLPSANALLFDVTPKQLLQIAGHSFSAFYRWQLKRYRYGMGVFKIDWALDDKIPFASEACSLAGTVHLGNTIEEIADSELAASKGQHPAKPFVLLAQQSLFDSSRAPAGKHTAWAYCHVPNGSTVNMTEAIEQQVERFAPGFRDRIIAKHTMNTRELQEHNPNYIGGDINGGIIDLGQLFTRPALRSSPYRSSTKGIYICSSSAPPGGGVHGMCGYHSAKQALKDIFKIQPNSLHANYRKLGSTIAG